MSASLACLDGARLGVVGAPGFLARGLDLLDLLLDRELVGQAGGLAGVALQGLEGVVVLAQIGLEAGALVLGPAVELVHLLIEP